VTREYRQTISPGALLALAGVVAWLCGLVGLGCAFPRTSQSSNQYSEVRSQQTAPPVPHATRTTQHAAASSSDESARAAAPVETNRPVNVTLAWDASPDPAVTGYRVYFGIAPEQYTNSVTTTATTVTISNLAPRTRYYFAATAFDATGVESDFSNEANWPLPRTNYVTVAVTRRDTLAGPATTLWSQTLTNPPGDSAFFETTIALTNNDVSVVRLNTSTLLIANTNQP
jgi:hypothetical protein